MSSHSSGENRWIWLPTFMSLLLRGIFALFMEPGMEKIKYSVRFLDFFNRKIQKMLVLLFFFFFLSAHLSF